MDKFQNSKPFSMVADFDGDFKKLFSGDYPKDLPILATRNLVLFPGVITPILVGRESSLRLIEHVSKKGGYMALICQRDSDIESPGKDDLYDTGVYAKVIKILDKKLKAMQEKMGIRSE